MSEKKMQSAKGKSIDIDKDLKSIGVTKAVQRGGQVELSIDPSTLSPSARKRIGSGLVKASAGTRTLDNDPWSAPYFEGPTNNSSRMNVHQKIRTARAFFQSDPLAGKIIEFMKVFSNDGFKNEHPDPDIKQFYDDWARNVNLELVLGWMFLEYYRSGNVVSLREMVAFKKEFKFMAPQYSVDGSFTGYAAEKKSETVKIPGAYTVLDPLTVFVKGNNAFNENLFFDPTKVKDETVESGDNTDPSKLLLRNVPRSIRAKHQGAKGVPLGRKHVRRILRMRQPYEPYGQIMMERAFAGLHEKNKLRQMDLTMVNSVINQIIKVTVGNDEYPATPRQLKNLAKAFQNTGKSQTIFWNHTLNIEVIRPDTKVLNKEKFERVNEDIRNAFGISEVLTGGGSAKTNFATAFLSLKSFLTNLQEGRRDILRWVRSEYEDIAEIMGFDSIPEPSFNPLSLTDEIAEKQIIVQLIDRGIISYQSAQSRLGYDPKIERQRREEELPDMKQGILGLSGSPFQEDISEEAIDTKEEVVKNVEKNKNKEVLTKDQEKVQINRRNNKTKNPSEKIAKNTPPEKKAANKIKQKEGRPKTPEGKKMPGRKSPKIKGQGSKDKD